MIRAPPKVPWSWQVPARRGPTGGAGGLDDSLTRTGVAATEQKNPGVLEYAKASFERIKQRLPHLLTLAPGKRVLKDCTLVSDLDRQFGDMPVGLRKMLLSMIHGFARTLAVSFASTSWRPAQV